MNFEDFEPLTLNISSNNFSLKSFSNFCQNINSYITLEGLIIDNIGA